MNPFAGGLVPQQQQSSSLAGSVFPQQPHSPTWGGVSLLGTNQQQLLGGSPRQANSTVQQQLQQQQQQQQQQQKKKRQGLMSRNSQQQLSTEQGARMMSCAYHQHHHHHHHQQQQQQQQYQQQPQGSAMRSAQQQYQQQPRVNATGSPRQTASYPLDITSTLGSSRELSGTPNSSTTSLVQAHAQSSPAVTRTADLAAMRAGMWLSTCVVKSCVCFCFEYRSVPSLWPEWRQWAPSCGASIGAQMGA